MDKYDNIEFFKNKNRQYIFDELTGALIKSEILGYIGSLQKDNIPFTLFFMDLDYFKTINDTYGHRVGDIVLRDVSKAIISCLDEDTVFGRFGGDEFLVVSRKALEYDDKWQLGRKICLAISGLKFDFGNGNITQTVSVSIGIATFPTDANTFNLLIERADKALYRGKMKGRNCFVIFNKALHENLKVNNDAASYELSRIIAYLNYEMTNYCYASFDTKLHQVSSFLGMTYGVDRITLSLEDKVMELYKHKDFNSIYKEVPLRLYNELGFKNQDILAINLRMHFEESLNELFKTLEDQNINAQVLIKVHTHSKEYGILRIDKEREVIWSSEVKVIFLTLANYIALLLETGLDKKIEKNQ